jgi:hypothetical protein
MHPSQSYPRRPLREEYPSRFSDSPALSAAFPSLDNLMTVAINLLKGFPFPFQKRAGLQRRVRPRLSPSKRRSRGSLPLDITDLNKFHLTNLKWYVKFFLVECHLQIKSAPFSLDFHFKSAHLILLNCAMAGHHGCNWTSDYENP